MDKLNIGQKISNVRKDKGLSLKDVCNKVEISTSMLSQIENGLANPSINTLRKIALILEVPLFTFFINDEDVQKLVVRKDERKIMSFSNDSFSYELLSPDLNGDIELALMILNPNSSSAEEKMAHDGEEVAFIVEGEVNIFLNDDKITLEEGDSIRIPSRMKHKWVNDFGQVCKVVFAISPPSF